MMLKFNQRMQLHLKQPLQKWGHLALVFVGLHIMHYYWHPGGWENFDVVFIISRRMLACGFLDSLVLTIIISNAELV